uniref:Odorant receptor n=1 Tax=Diaphorina citri TaxID=121845 RepID=A0A7T3R192_DIACI|nr:odorant receptor 6 [Diaphorina citri]
MGSPTSIRYLLSIVEAVGFFNERRRQRDWRWRLGQLLMYFQYSVGLAFAAVHFYSTVTQSIRYLPEFFQTFLEDVFLMATYIACLQYKINYAEVEGMIRFMETSFSQFDSRVILKYKKRADLMFNVYLTMAMAIMCGALLEPFFSKTAAEFKIRRLVYQTDHPEKRHPFNVRIPGVDETQPGVFEAIYLFEIIYGFIFALVACVIMPIIPMIVIHLQGQFELLCHHVRKIGTSHEWEDYQIYYTDIETDQFCMALYSERMTREKDSLLNCDGQRNGGDWQRNQRDEYDWSHFRQVLKFHQKLLMFRDQLTGFCNNIAFLVIICNNICLSLCLFQLTNNPGDLPPVRLLKFVGQFLNIVVQSFLICNSSELLDDYNTMLRRAFNESCWYACAPRTRRNIVFFLRSIQEPGHVRFYQGTVVLSRKYFLKIVQVSYSIVNAMRLRSNLS